jgi:hypothetical protein
MISDDSPTYRLLLSVSISPISKNPKQCFRDLIQLFYHLGPTKILTYLRNQDLVSRLHTNSDQLSILIASTRTDSQNSGLVQFLHTRLGKENASGGLSLGFDALNKHAIEKRSEGLDGLECGSLKVHVSVCSGVGEYGSLKLLVMFM